MPLYRRIPKRGFKSLNKVIYNLINMETLNLFKDSDEVNSDILIEKGLIKSNGAPVKILANGDLKVKNLKIKVNAVSQSAMENLLCPSWSSHTWTIHALILYLLSVPGKTLRTFQFQCCFVYSSVQILDFLSNNNNLFSNLDGVDKLFDSVLVLLLILGQVKPGSRDILLE